MCKGQAGKRRRIAALIEKLKKPDNNELLRTVAIPLITAAFAAMAVIIAAHFTSRSTIEAARLAMQNQVNTEKDLGRALYLERSIYRGEPPTKQGETHAVKAYPYADQNSDTTLINYGEDSFIIEAAITNEYNNVWYRLEPNAETNYYSPSGQAYIFSGNVVYVSDAAQIEWFDSISGKQFNANALRILTGEIHSTNRMIKLKAEINDGGKIVRGPVEQELGGVYNYSMAKSPLEVLMFCELKPSNNYELLLEITYYSCGENLELTYSQAYPFIILP